MSRRDFLRLLKEEEEVPDDGKTELVGMLKVKAEQYYANGSLCPSWNAGEIREIPETLYKQLLKDNAYNWRIID